MVQDGNLYEEASHFFGSIPYHLVAGEQIELRYVSLDRRVHNAEFFANMKAAAQRATALAPAYHVFAGMTPRTTVATDMPSRLLASWMPVGWHGRLLDDFSAKLDDGPAPIWVEVRVRRPDKLLAVVTARYYYADRCRVPERVRSRAETLLTRTENVGSGWRGRL